MRRAIALTAAWTALVCATGCVSVAEFRKLEREVLQMRNGGAGGPAARERVADLGAELAAVNARLDALEGRVEVAEHEASGAMEEARRARQQAEKASLSPAGGAPAAAPGGAAPSDGSPQAADAAASEEVEAYRLGHEAWSAGELDACIDRFRSFLQTYPASPYADDASYWMADCHFRQGDYKTAILRFDDVVSRYPDGDKSADALYRQGEALLKLGPAYSKAAGKAFERVLAEYPSSPRAVEAKRQLELLRAG